MSVPPILEVPPSHKNRSQFEQAMDRRCERALELEEPAQTNVNLGMFQSRAERLSAKSVKSGGRKSVRHIAAEEGCEDLTHDLHFYSSFLLCSTCPCCFSVPHCTLDTFHGVEPNASIQE